MKLEQTSIEKTFHIRMGNKIYYVNYLNSDGQIIGLINRLDWEIHDEDGEEVNIYYFSNMTDAEKRQVDRNCKLVENLIDFCIKHFNDYNPPL